MKPNKYMNSPLDDFIGQMDSLPCNCYGSPLKPAVVRKLHIEGDECILTTTVNMDFFSYWRRGKKVDASRPSSCTSQLVVLKSL